MPRSPFPLTISLLLLALFGSQSWAAENLFEIGLDAPAQTLIDGVPLGWIARPAVPGYIPAKEFTFTEDAEKSKDSKKPFTRLNIKGEEGFFVLESHKIVIPEPGDYRFSMELDSAFSTSLGINFRRQPHAQEEPVIIYEAPRGVNVYKSKFSAEIMRSSFPPGDYHEVVLHLTVPPGVESIVINLRCRVTETDGNTLAFGNVKLEKETEEGH